MQYFYDEQIRRYLTQFMRLLGEFSVKTGKDRNGEHSYIQVPVRYGDINRMAAHIMKNQSENVINTVPFISCYVTDMQINAERRYNPTHVDKVQVYEKKFDYESGTYIDNEIGNTYTVERYMPVPYDMTVQVDIWTSNTDQKLQLLEQLLVLFNPSINLQVNDNPFDWTALTYTELINIVWSLRQVPSGTDDIIDVAALNFTIPIFINPPAKVKRQTLINTILTEIKNLKGDESLDWNPEAVYSNKEWVILGFDDLGLQVRIEGDYALLLSKTGTGLDSDGNILSWASVLKPYGEFRPGISNLRLRRTLNPEDISKDVVAVMTGISESQPNKIFVSIDEDSLPPNTVNSIISIIDPVTVAPDNGLVGAVLGQRYLLSNSTAGNGLWTGVVADKNDIIEYNGSSWIVSFASASTDYASVIDLSTNFIYEWNGKLWTSPYAGTYKTGWWRLYL